MNLWTDRYTGNKTLSFSFWRIRGQVTLRAKPRGRWIDNICWKCVGWRCRIRPYFCWWYGHDWVNQIETWDEYRGYVAYNDSSTCRWCNRGRKRSK